MTIDYTIQNETTSVFFETDFQLSDYNAGYHFCVSTVLVFGFLWELIYEMHLIFISYVKL